MLPKESGGLLELANQLAKERSFWWILKKTVCYSIGMRDRLTQIDPILRYPRVR